MAETRASEEIRVLRGWLQDRDDSVSGSTLTFLVWHTANLVRLATGGEYEIIVRSRSGETVEPIDLQGAPVVDDPS